LKLRLLDDSIRLRLSRGDVSDAHEKGVVEAQTRFPDGSALNFALETSTMPEASAAFAAERLVVRLPAQQVAAWAGDDSVVSIMHEVDLPDGGQLKLLVEKDFQCLTARPDEDQSDLFTNPDTASC
jgi:hypothetical protein